MGENVEGTAWEKLGGKAGGEKLEGRSWKEEAGGEKLEGKSWKEEAGGEKLEGKAGGRSWWGEKLDGFDQNTFNTCTEFSNSNILQN